MAGKKEPIFYGLTLQRWSSGYSVVAVTSADRSYYYGTVTFLGESGGDRTHGRLDRLTGRFKDYKSAQDAITAIRELDVSLKHYDDEIKVIQRKRDGEHREKLAEILKKHGATNE